MPIASERPTSVNAGLMANAVVEPQSTAVNSFMDAFKSGFLTVDDINKRVRGNVAEQDALKTSLAANELKRKEIAQEGELAPVKFQLAKGQTELEQLKQQLAQTQVQEGLVMATGTPEEQQQLMEKKKALQDQAEYIGYFGSLPESLKVGNGDEMPEFQDWVKNSPYSDAYAKSRGPLKPLPTLTKEEEQTLPPAEQELRLKTRYDQADAEDAATASTMEEAMQVYNQLKEKSQGTTAVKGTPEYLNALRDKLEAHRSTLKEREVRLQAAPQAIVAGVKAEAETKVAAQKQEAEKRNNFQKEIAEDKLLMKYRSQLGYYNQVQRLASDPDTVNNPAMQKALMYSVIRAWDPDSAVRDGEINFLASRPGLQNVWDQMVGSLTNGRRLTTSQLQELKAMADKSLQISQGSVEGSLKAYRDRASRMKIPPSEFASFIPAIPGAIPSADLDAAGGLFETNRPAPSVELQRRQAAQKQTGAVTGTTTGAAPVPAAPAASAPKPTAQAGTPYTPGTTLGNESRVRLKDGRTGVIRDGKFFPD